jgi:hypothetical protein
VQADAATDEVYARLALVAEDKVSVALQSIRTSLLLAVGALCFQPNCLIDFYWRYWTCYLFH